MPAAPRAHAQLFRLKRNRATFAGSRPFGGGLQAQGPLSATTAAPWSDSAGCSASASCALRWQHLLVVLVV
eukprot:1131695-Pyramimonas_sp.AAC.1